MLFFCFDVFVLSMSCCGSKFVCRQVLPSLQGVRCTCSAAEQKRCTAATACCKRACLCVFCVALFLCRFVFCVAWLCLVLLLLILLVPCFLDFCTCCFLICFTAGRAYRWCSSMKRRSLRRVTTTTVQAGLEAWSTKILLAASRQVQ